MIQKTQETHSIPLWLLREYLEELGGTAENDNYVVGDGWTAVLTKLEPRKVGSLQVGQVEIKFAGEPETLDQLKTEFHKKTMRAGA